MTSVLALLDGIGTPELLVISVLALLMFGSKRLPELGRGLGRAIREFKRATSGVEENLREVLRDDPTPTIRPPLRQGTPRSNANPFTQSTWETPTIETSTASATALPSAASPSPDDAAANASAHDHDATAHDHHSADPAAPHDSGDTPRSSPGSEASHS